MTGPGDVYIASRLEPRFPTLKRSVHECTLSRGSDPHTHSVPHAILTHSLGRSSRSQGALDATVVVARTTPSPDAAAKTPVARSVSAAAAIDPGAMTARPATNGQNGFASLV